MSNNKRHLFTIAAALLALVLAVGLLAGTGLAQTAVPDMPGAAAHSHNAAGPMRAGAGMQTGTPITDTAMCPGQAVMHGGMMHGGLMGRGMMGRGMMNRGMMRQQRMPQGCMANGIDAGGTVTDTLDSTQVAAPEGFAAALETADAGRGQQLTVAHACTGCHSVNHEQRMVGPTWHDLAETAAGRVVGQTAEEYLYTSIVRPNAYVVEGYLPNVMIQSYGQTLGVRELADVVKYLLTLRG